MVAQRQPFTQQDQLNPSSANLRQPSIQQSPNAPPLGPSAFDGTPTGYVPQGRDAYRDTIPMRPSGAVQQPGAPNPFANSQFIAGMDPNTPNPFQYQPPGPPQLQDPGNNMVNPGYGEQAAQITQNRLLEDPYGQQSQNLANQAGQSSQGQDYLNQNLGSLAGPGQGSQYWQQQQGQYNNPMTGEQFAREATQNLSPTGASGAFYDQAMQSYGQNGQYGGPNLAAGQYGQTQQSFGDLPVATSADPFYDRSVQLGTQAYNQQAAGRGVYGSSESLSGVGNMISGLEAQRAQKAFDNTMAISQEQRARQQLLGEQARMGDLSGLEAFDRNLAGVETYGNLAGQADDVEGQRYRDATTAMNNADRTALDRINSGADVAFRADDSERADYNAETGAATAAGNLDNNRLQTANNIVDSASRRDLDRLDSYNDTAQGAEGQRQDRVTRRMDDVASFSRDMINTLSSSQREALAADDAAFDDYFNTQVLPQLQAAGMSAAEAEQLRTSIRDAFKTGKDVYDEAKDD